jgi:hypothetical protein
MSIQNRMMLGDCQVERLGTTGSWMGSGSFIPLLIADDETLHYNPCPLC